VEKISFTINRAKELIKSAITKIAGVVVSIILFVVGADIVPPDAFSSFIALGSISFSGLLMLQAFMWFRKQMTRLGDRMEHMQEHHSQEMIILATSHASTVEQLNKDFSDTASKLRAEQRSLLLRLGGLEELSQHGVFELRFDNGNSMFAGHKNGRWITANEVFERMAYTSFEQLRTIGPLSMDVLRRMVNPNDWTALQASMLSLFSEEAERVDLKLKLRNWDNKGGSLWYPALMRIQTIKENGSVILQGIIMDMSDVYNREEDLQLLLDEFNKLATYLANRMNKLHAQNKVLAHIRKVKECE
jgi:hypothetical protein